MALQISVTEYLKHRSAALEAAVTPWLKNLGDEESFRLYHKSRLGLLNVSGTRWVDGRVEVRVVPVDSLGNPRLKDNGDVVHFWCNSPIYPPEELRSLAMALTVKW